MKFATRIFAHRAASRWLAAGVVVLVLGGVLWRNESLIHQPIHLQPLAMRMNAFKEVQTTAAQRTPDHIRILFIGNSFTLYHGGQAALLTQLARASQPPLPVMIEQVAIGGASFKSHWDVGLARKRIDEGAWDIVVLQDHSYDPVSNREKMFDYAHRFDKEIKRVGARTVLFMTWPRLAHQSDGPIIAAAYEALGRELHAPVIPIGFAWKRALHDNPDLSLYEADGKHPSPQGSYLTACLFYTMLFHASPMHLPCALRLDETTLVNINPVVAKELQNAAMETATAGPAVPMLTKLTSTRPTTRPAHLSQTKTTETPRA